MTQEDRIETIVLLIEDYRNNASGDDGDKLDAALYGALGWMIMGGASFQQVKKSIRIGR